MSIDRKQMLLQRANALAAMNRQDLPLKIRAAYKTAADQADLALGLQDAQARKSSMMLSAPPAENALQPQPTLQPTPQLNSALQT